MIKYITRGLGSKALNKRARDEANYYLKPKLKGMRCGKCKQDTLIEFREPKQIYFGFLQKFCHACCPKFEKRIKDKLGHEFDNS